jgi:hypothetical protein
MNPIMLFMIPVIIEDGLVVKVVVCAKAWTGMKSKRANAKYLQSNTDFD